MYGLNIDNNTYLINLIFTNTQAQQLSICILTHNKVYSIQKLYSNSVWYEREVSEFLPVKFLSSSDTRNLLLPYT
jgi:NADH:ubiquinone oxidoreductase subunit C